MQEITLTKIQALDKDGMREKIMEFPEQLLQGWEIGVSVDLPFSLSQFDHILFSGMGGSAIAGDLLSSLLKNSLKLPFYVNRGYQLPGFVNSKTLFIASSYSGNTEETLSSLQKAEELGCTILCMTSGGTVLEKAQIKGYPLFQMKPGYPPRSALGFSLGILLALFKQLGVSKIDHVEIKRSVTILNEKHGEWQNLEKENNLPLYLARECFGKLPLIYIDLEWGSIGSRWKAQLNENSKTHAFCHVFPEMNHNEIVGWESLTGTASFLSNMAAILLRTGDESDRIKKRMDITKSLIKQSGVTFLDINAKGLTFFEKWVYFISLGDWFSLYLAILNDVNPTEIQKINLLKEQLQN